MKTSKNGIWCLLALTICLATDRCIATTVLSSDGFESSAFQLGALDGQDGWIATHTGPPTTTAVVQDALSASGSQAVRLDRESNSDGFFINFGLGGGSTGPYALLSGRYLSIDWDMRYEPVPASSVGDVGPFFSVEVFDESSGPVKSIAAFGVDSAANEYLYQRGGDGQFMALTRAASPSLWNRYRLDLDFQEQTYSMFIDDELVATTGFIDAASGISRWTDINLVGRAAGGDPNSLANEGTAYIDNLIARDGLRGDFNNNGVLDAADYTVWRAQNGSSGFGLAGDANADGTVTATDYFIWADAFGQSNTIIPAATSIPEPAAGVLLVMLAAWRPRRVSR